MDQKFPKSLKDVLGVGYRKRLGLPYDGTLPPLPGGGLLSGAVSPPEADPEPPEATAEEAIDTRLAAALASLETDDFNAVH